MSQKKTIYDIASLAGVSPASVSRCTHHPESMRESTKQKIWDAFSSLGLGPEDLSFQFKSGNTRKKSGNHIPVILVCVPGFLNPFYDDIIEVIQEHLRRESYTMLLYGQSLSRSNLHQFLEMATSIQVNGLILADHLPEEVLLRLNAHYPLVQCSEYNSACPNIPYVTVDDYSTTQNAIRYLVQAGCKNIGFFSAPYRQRYVQNRYQAYKSVLAEAGLPMRPEYVMQVSNYSYDRILTAAQRFFMYATPPDAIFAVSDKHAHALIKAATAAGFRIPEDLKIIGFDNTMYATLSTPTITTIAQPRRELATESAKILLEKIKQPKLPAVSKVLPSKIIFREST